MSPVIVPVAIIGGSGYGAGEIMRLLSYHPNAKAVSVTSRSHAGKPVYSVHSHLLGINELAFEAKVPFEKLARSERSIVIVSVPHGESLPIIENLLNGGAPEGLTVIDLSGDLRLRSAEIHALHYPQVPFAEKLRNRFVYGLPEAGRTSLEGARFVSNPGCLATASALALLPAVRLGFTGDIVIDVKTGTSGAGREPQASMHHPARATDFTAYKVLEHRHEPEILQALGDPAGERLKLMFVPHLLPVPRGILVTCYLTAESEARASELARAYSTFYDGSVFVRSRSTPPRLVDVVGTNFCDISVVTRGRQFVVMSAIDNLGKGMAGQAIQNLNLCLGLPESTGLLQPALGPA